MQKDMPLLAIQLIARREARGLTQEEMARVIDVDPTTLWRWENGKSKPKGKQTIGKIRDTYGFTQAQLDDWYSDWSMKMNDHDGKYYVRGFEFLKAQGMDEYDLLDRLIEIDTEIIPRIMLEDEGTTEQWAPIFVASPFTWKLLTYGDRVVGYWQYLCLKDQYYEMVKSGQLRDAEITTEMIEAPSFVKPEKNFKMYVVMVGVDAAHQHIGAGNRLIQSFIKEVQRAAQSGLFFSEVCAIAFSLQGLHLCRDCGMKRIGHHTSVAEDELAEIYHMDGRDIPRVGFLGKNANLSRLYRERFG